jgi:glycopeptide antibiotics resistance protein
MKNKPTVDEIRDGIMNGVGPLFGYSICYITDEQSNKIDKIVEKAAKNIHDVLKAKKKK